MWCALQLDSRIGGTASPLATTMATSSPLSNSRWICDAKLAGRQRLQVRDLRRAEQLHAERVDEVHVADLADRRLERRLAGEHAVAAVAAGDPAELQPVLVVGERAARR